MVSVSRKLSISMILGLAFMAMLATSGTAHDDQPVQPFPFLPIPGLFPFPGDVQKCWSSLNSIQGCVMEIFTSLTSLFRGQIGIIGPNCCRAISQISNNCLPKMFPLTPFLTPLLQSSCPSSRLSAANMNANKQLSVPGLLPYLPGKGIRECWSPLASVKDCVFQIFRSRRRSGNQIGPIGQACCKAIVNVSDGCWTKLFPLNPLFPPLLKNSCLRDAAAVPIAPGPSSS